MKERKVEICYPSFSKKALTFTIDDGNITYDAKFLNILKPHGIKGTFNLCAPNRATPEEYRAFYEGYEIANHCKNHPFCFEEGQPFRVSDEPLDTLNSKEYTEEDPVVYRSAVEDVYKIHMIPARIKPDGWFSITTRENYVRFARETREELEEVFGKGSIKSFVWPFREQTNTVLFDTLVSDGYNSIRKTGAIGDSTGFALPSDRMRWTYNAVCTNLLELMAKYESYPDDGNLKFFCFGVHSYDFERAEKWDDLREYARLYGNRPSDFWYATVSEIFEYEDAVNELQTTDDAVINGSDVALYLEINGERVVIEPDSSYEI
jgi:hypothetical protein